MAEKVSDVMDCYICLRKKMNGMPSSSRQMVEMWLLTTCLALKTSAKLPLPICSSLVKPPMVFCSFCGSRERFEEDGARASMADKLPATGFRPNWRRDCPPSGTPHSPLQMRIQGRRQSIAHEELLTMSGETVEARLRLPGLGGGER